MTVIAWDGKTLVADTQATYSHNGRTKQVTKIVRYKGELLASCGCEHMREPLFDWYKRGASVDDYPKIEQGEETSLIVVNNKNVKVYLGAYPYLQPHDFVDGWGSGGEIALGAMLAGNNAESACELVCGHSMDCGMPLTVLPLDVSKNTAKIEKIG